MLKFLKTVAIVATIGVSAVAMITFGMFIGSILLFLAAVAGSALGLVLLWKMIWED